MKKKPWPTKDAMKQVYDLKLWGDNNTAFYSGEGSHNDSIVQPYLEAVQSFLSSFEFPLTVCDLGCGDFNIGKELLAFTSSYIAVDIVPELIEHNRSVFQLNNLQFESLDIAVDSLPQGDCAIVRQVLQHLSNDEVSRVVSKLSGYNYVILTEHLPNGEFIPNIDIISGQGIRIKKKSGIRLTDPPFSMQVKNEKQLLRIQLKDGKGVIETMLYTF